MRPMKRNALRILPLILFFCAALESYGQVPPGKRFGFGFSLGEPTAITLKWRASSTTAYDFGLGHSMMGYPRVHADYVWQFFYLFARTEYRLNVYAGFGGAVGFGDKGRYLLFDTNADSSRWYYSTTGSVAARGVAGINYFVNRPGLEVFLELNPLIGFVPEPALDFEAAIGVRMYLF